MKILWYISPVDGPRPWTKQGRYPVDHRRLRRLAMTLDQGGFYGALVGTYTHETWTTSVSLIGSTERLRFMIPQYPGATPPVPMVQRALTFDDYSGGRLILHLVNGLDGTSAHHGVTLGHDERYEMALEYWELFRRLYSGEQFDHRGRYFTVEGYRTSPDIPTSLPLGPIQLPHTPFWGGGDSLAGTTLAGKLLDSHFTMLRQPDRMAAVIEAASNAAAANGRTVRHGALASVIVRETEEEALAAFYSMFLETGAESIAHHEGAALKHFAGAEGGIAVLRSDDPAVQARIEALSSGRLPTLEELQIAPLMYAGMTSWSTVDLVGAGIATYLVGSAEQVAARLRELQSTLSLDTFILSGWPLIREAEYVADLLLPLLDLDHEPPVLAASLAEPQLVTA